MFKQALYHIQLYYLLPAWIILRYIDILIQDERR